MLSCIFTESVKTSQFVNIDKSRRHSHRLCRCETRPSLPAWTDAGHGDLDGSWGSSQRKQRVQMVSAAEYTIEAVCLEVCILHAQVLAFMVSTG